jgi:hypothetical protein
VQQALKVQPDQLVLKALKVLQGQQVQRVLKEQ